MRSWPRTVLAVLLVLALTAACGGNGASVTTQATTPAEVATTEAPEAEAVTETDSSIVITITGLSFPAEVAVPAGKGVTWINDSSAPHEVQMETLDGAPVDVEPVRLGTDQEGELSLEPGTWTYFCTIHPAMTGSLIVEG
ncbi:MAG: cupredoxin domain-containing protein [Acidimicrobiia bacterium]